MRNKCLLGLGLVFVISLTSMVAFAFSFTGTPADEVDETEIIVSAVVSEEADAMPTTEPITTTGQEMEKNEQSKIGSMDWDESHGATYFESKSDSTWHSENLTFLFKHGKHYFYKE